MKRSHLNFALVAIVAGLSAAVYFGQKKEEKGPPLTALKPDAVNDVRIEHPNAPAIHLHKDAGHWKLLEPVQADADPVEINGILSLAELETKLTLEPSAVKLAELKLDPPEYTVTLNDVKLALGDVEPLNYRRYVATGGKVQLVDDPPSAALDADFSDLVDKAPIPAGADIVKVVLPALTVERDADGKSWKVTPDDPKAGADARQKFIDGWKSARALWMAAEPKEGSKGDAVDVTLKDGRVLHFVLVARDPQPILARPDLKVRYTLSKELEGQILKLPVEEPKAAPTATPAEPAAPTEPQEAPAPEAAPPKP